MIIDIHKSDYFHSCMLDNSACEKLSIELSDSQKHGLRQLTRQLFSPIVVDRVVEAEATAEAAEPSNKVGSLHYAGRFSTGYFLTINFLPTAPATR